MRKCMKKLVGIVICLGVLATVAGTSKPAFAEESTPTQAGKVFAGYYKDEECTVPLMAEEKEEYEGEKYAKFVNENVLTLKAQLKRGTVAESTVTDLRLLTSVDNLNYQKISFEFNYNGQTKTYTTNVAYKVVKAYMDGSDEPEIYEPETTFSEDSHYFMVYTVKNIPVSVWNGNFTVTPKWTTMDGTEVCGTTKVFAVNDGLYDAKFVDEEDVIHRGSLGEMLTLANASTEDALVEVTRDSRVSVGAAEDRLTVDNANGKNVTIEGNGHTIETRGGYEIIFVDQLTGTVTFQNLNINHRGNNILLVAGKYDKTANNLTVKLEHMNIDAQSSVNDAYKDCLMCVGPWAGTTNLELTDVYLTEEAPGKETGSVYPRVIGNRNTGNADSRNMNLTMTDCTIDARKAPLKGGIRFLGSSTKGTVRLTNTKIFTNNHYAATNGSGRVLFLADEDCVLDMENHSEDKPNDTSIKEARIGSTGYDTLADALTAANAATANVTVELRANCSVSATETDGAFTINNENNKNVTIEGCGCKLTTAGTKNIFHILQSSGTVTLQNMDIAHKNTSMLIRVGEKTSGTNTSSSVTTKLKNMNIVADGTGNYAYQYALINLYAVGTPNLEMTDVNAKVVASNSNQNTFGLIRTGNDDDSSMKTTKITLTRCKLDLTEANGRAGIQVRQKTNGTVIMTDSEIKTKNYYAILFSGNGNNSLSEGAEEMVSCSTASPFHHATPIFYSYMAKIGSTNYATFKAAVDAANTKTGDVEIQLLHDMAIDRNTSNAYTPATLNVSGDRVITINGNGHKITTCGPASGTTSTTPAITLAGTAGRVILQNMEVTHNSKNNLIGTSGTSANEEEDLTIALEEVEVTASNNGTGSVICAGGTDQTRKVHVTLTDSVINTAAVTGRSAIQIKEGTESIVGLNRSEITTKNTYAIRFEGGEGEVVKSGDSVFNTGSAYYMATPVYRYQAQIGDVKYFNFHDAVTAANAVEEGTVEIELLSDFALDIDAAGKAVSTTLTSTSSRNILVSGNDHTVTTCKTTSDGNAITINGSAGSVAFQNMKFVHNGKNILMATTANSGSIKLSLTDVDIKALHGEITDGDTYQYAVLNCLGKAETTFVGINLTIKENISNAGHANGAGVIRTGNPTETKTAYITLINSLIDASEANNRAGILASNKNTVVVKLVGTEILTMNKEPIRTQGNTDLTIRYDEGSSWNNSKVKEDLYYKASTATVKVSDTVEDESGYTHRVILLTDPHYMSNYTPRVYKWLHSGAILSDAAGPTFGFSQKAKMDAIVNDVATFNAETNVEKVFILGDLSTDDYGYRNLPENFVEKFKTDVMDKLPVEAYAIPGNHDSYSNATWESIFGYGRQYSVKVGNAAFIMIDTYSDAPATSGSGSRYISVDMDWLRTEIAKYPTEQIFLCSHYYWNPSASENPSEQIQTANTELAALISSNNRIVCMFDGHEHKNKTNVLTSWNSKRLVNLGGYAYPTADGKYNDYTPGYEWGFGVLEWNNTEAHYYHVKNPRTYKGDNGTFQYEGAIEDEFTVSLWQ